MVEKSLTITGMYHVELLATKTRIAPMNSRIVRQLYAGLTTEVNGNNLIGTG